MTVRSKYPPEVAVNAADEIEVTFTFDGADAQWMHLLLEKLDRPPMKQFRLRVTGNRLLVEKVSEASTPVLMSELNAAIRSTNDERAPQVAGVKAEAEKVRAQVQSLFKAEG